MTQVSRVVGLIVLVAVAALATWGLAADDDDPPVEAKATAPIAPPRVPAPPAPAATDEPGEGVEAEEARKVQLGLPSPGDFRPTTPQHAVARFHDAWHDRAWDRMALWTSPAWRADHADPGAELRER